MSNMKLFIIDDDSIFLEGIVSLCSRESDIEVVGTAKSGEEAIRSIKQLKPNMVLSDVRLSKHPDKMDGIMLAKHLLSSIDTVNPELKVVLMSNDPKLYESRASQVPIKACVDKLDGYRAIIGLLAHIHVTGSRTMQKPKSSPLKLDDDEVAVFRLMLSGCDKGGSKQKATTAKAIAEAMHISEVKKIQNIQVGIRKKLGHQAPLEMVRYALKYGLISLQDLT